MRRPSPAQREHTGPIGPPFACEWGVCTPFENGAFDFGALGVARFVRSCLRSRMGNVCSLGFRTYQASCQGGVVRHAAGLNRPENALPRPGWPAVRDLLADEESPGVGWPAAPFEDDGWSTGPDLGPADVSPFEPGAPATIRKLDETGKPELDAEGQPVLEPPPRSRRSFAVRRAETRMAKGAKKLAALLKGRRGAKPCKSVEMLFTGPPAWDSPEAWEPDRVMRWSRDVLRYVRESLPDTPIVAATLHLDERSPHLHIVVAPIVVDGNGKTRLGAKAIRKRLAATAPPRKASLKGQYRDELSRAAAGYAWNVGQHYGLEAGRVASTTKHVPVNPVEGAQRRAADLEKKTETAKAELKRVNSNAEGARRVTNLHRTAKGVLQDDQSVILNRNAELLVQNAALSTRQSEAERLAVEAERAGNQAEATRDQAKREANQATTERDALVGLLDTIREQYERARGLFDRLVAATELKLSKLRGEVATVRGQRDSLQREANGLAQTIAECKSEAEQAAEEQVTNQAQADKFKAAAQTAAEEAAAATAAATDAEQRRENAESREARARRVADESIASFEQRAEKAREAAEGEERRLAEVRAARAEEERQRRKDADLGAGFFPSAVRRGNEERAEWEQKCDRLESQRDAAQAHAAALEATAAQVPGLKAQVDRLERQVKMSGWIEQAAAEGPSRRRRSSPAADPSPSVVSEPVVHAPERGPGPGPGQGPL